MQSLRLVHAGVSDIRSPPLQQTVVYEERLEDVGGGDL